MIVQTHSRLTMLMSASLGLLLGGSAFAGGSGPPPECGWGVARDLAGNNKFLIDEDKDGVADVSFVFGPSTADVLVGDWNGDGIENVAIRRDIGGLGKFFFNNNSDASDENAFVLGEIGAMPLSGDWNGDGTDNAGVRRDVGGLGKFFLDTNGAPVPEIAFVFGSTADIPVVGDWDGDGDDNIGIVRDVSGSLRWFFASDSGAVTSAFGFGQTGDTPIVGDWDNDGDDDPGLIRTVGPTLKYFLDSNHDGAPDITLAFGTAATDTSLVCDFSGMGDEIGVARQDAGNGALRFLTSPALDGLIGLRVRFGNDTDTPIVGTFVGLSGL